MILALDPSSTRTGYAIFEESGELAEAGYFLGERKADYLQRVKSMRVELAKLWMSRDVRATQVIIEIPSGKVGSGQRRGATASLAIYGFAAGAMWMQCLALFAQGSVHTVDERVWTRRVPKAKRAKLIAMEFPQYARAMELDGGGDVADAIGLGLWWIGHEKRRALGVA